MPAGSRTARRRTSPEWCADPWCYVDAATCSYRPLLSSSYFPGADLKYSYRHVRLAELVRLTGLATTLPPAARTRSPTSPTC